MVRPGLELPDADNSDPKPVPSVWSASRTQTVYAGGIWGGHAWIDVRIGNDWIPLDGALYTSGPADAASPSFGQLLRHVDIKVLQYTVAGRSIDVPEGAAPFVIEKDLYRNPWLGLSVRKP